MFRLPLHALLIFVLAGSASAQDASVPASSVDSHRSAALGLVHLTHRPSLLAVREAFQASGLKNLDTLLIVDYDAKGMVVNVVLEQASGNEALDQAILDWGRRIRVTPGIAGRGKLPFRLVTDGGVDDAPSVPRADKIPTISIREMVVGKPSLVPVMQAMAYSNVSKADAEVVLDYSAAGDVTHAVITKGSGIVSVDKAILKWAKQLKLKPGVAGTGRLPFTLQKH